VINRTRRKTIRSTVACVSYPSTHDESIKEVSLHLSTRTLFHPTSKKSFSSRTQLLIIIFFAILPPKRTTPSEMRAPLGYLEVDLSELFGEDWDGSRHSEDEEEVVSSRERMTGKENSDSRRKENVDPWAKRFSRARSMPTPPTPPTPELNLLSCKEFVPTAPNENVENKSQARPTRRGEEREKTYRIQTIGEVYALQKRGGKEQLTFGGNKEGRSRNCGTNRLTLRKINEPLLMDTGCVYYKRRNSARSKERRGRKSNDSACGCQAPGGDEAYAAWFPDNGHDDPTQAESVPTNSWNASAGPSSHHHLPDMGNPQSSTRGGALLHQWNQTAGQRSHIHETHPALPEGGLDVPQAPPADAATLHSQMCPSFYGGYGFPHRGPFYNPIVPLPPPPHPVAPPHPTRPILTIGSPYPVVAEHPTLPRPTADSSDQQLQMPIVGSTFHEANRELNPEAIAWIPGRTPFTSNLPISVIRRASLPDLYVLRGLEYASQRESWENKLEELESKPPAGIEAGAMSTAGYAGLLACNMMEETNPLLAGHFKLGKNRFHEARRYVSMQDSLGSRGKSEGIGSRRPSWSHLGCLD